MKRVFCLILSAVMAFALASCSVTINGGGDKDEGFEWTRDGFFEDEDGNYLAIYESDYEEYPGWSVSLMMGEENHGWFIRQEGNALHGNLVPDYEEGEYIVTVTEEGENGVQVQVENGETYHFTAMDVPDANMSIYINTVGQGQIAYAEEGETIEFDEEYPAQSAQINLAEPATYVLAAKAEEGSEFVKWTKDGEDFSTEEQITVELTETTEFIAVFE
jgi:hypothetical protein